MSGVKRRYTSQRRLAQAEATRRDVVASARRLLVRSGYAATTVEAIAREAGVAVQTVYATFGTKRAVLFALVDAIDLDADVARYLHELSAARGDPRRQLRLVVAFDRRLYERAHDVILIGRDAGRVDPDVQAWGAEGERRHREGPRRVVAQWAALGALAAGLSEQEAADVLATMTNFDVYRLLVLESGWQNDRYEAWLVESLERLLFGG